MIKYLSGVANKTLAAVAMQNDIGILVTPDTRQYEAVIGDYPLWATDNGCFNHPNRSVEDMLNWIRGLSRKDAEFFPAPDVVGDAVKTIERSLPVLPLIRAAGFKAAYVIQNGIENTTIPWDQLDAIFIGGDTEFKLGEQARLITAEAKRLNKWVHMGRVNSFKRLKIANDWGCDSADGTYLRFTGTSGVATIVKWMERLRAEDQKLQEAA
jgi:hypothetical protein